jgi:hypothetical protein
MTRPLVTLAALVGCWLALVPLAAGAQHAYPSSLVVLGASTASGYGADPAHPYSTSPQDSWGTGTNPDVKSVYSRLLALNPAIKGHAVNLAYETDAGTELDELARQVHHALALDPKPQLVLIQVLDRNIRCDGSTENDVVGYGAKFSAALDTLAQGLPDARIVVVSQWASTPSYVSYLQSLSAGARLKHAGKSPCQLVESPSGRVSPARVAYANKVVAGEEAQLRSACAQHPQCRYDGGAAGRVAVTPADISLYQFTPSAQGQAKLAAAEWAVVAAAVGA